MLLKKENSKQEKFMSEEILNKLSEKRRFQQLDLLQREYDIYVILEEDLISKFRKKYPGMPILEHEITSMMDFNNQNKYLYNQYPVTNKSSWCFHEAFNKHLEIELNLPHKTYRRIYMAYMNKGIDPQSNDIKVNVIPGSSSSKVYTSIPNNSYLFRK